MKTLRLLFVTLASLWLAGCGDFGSLADSRVRLVNATTGGYESLDLYVDGEREVAGVAAGTVSGWRGVASGSFSVALARAPSTTPLAAATREIRNDTDHTVVAYGRTGSLKAVMLVEDEPRPASGRARLRVLNAGSDAGAIDVYLTAADEPLGDASPVASGVAADDTSDWTTVNVGDFRLRVTGAGDRDDLRLDVGGLRLDSRQVATLIVTGTPGGVLVDGALVVQGGALTKLANTSARVRVVAAIAGGARVGVRAGDRVLAADAVSPQVGSYALLPAGDWPLAVKVDGAAVAAPALAAAAGADLSLLVAGRAGAAQLRVIADDNRRPTVPTAAKLRLLHAVADLDEAMTLAVGFTPLASAHYGEASAPAQQPAGSGQRLDVTSPTAPATKFSLTDLTLDAGSVYTVFMLGSFDDPATTLAASLRKDR